MDRRTFLKATAGVLMIPVIPSLAATPDLEEWFKQNFKCQNGLPGPYTEVQQNGKTFQYAYQTFAAGIVNVSESHAKDSLTRYFVEQFTPYVGSELYWRVEPQFAEIPVVTYGDTWMTAEEVEDKKVDKVEVPNGVEFDFDTGSYKYVEDKDIFYRMRFRLAIPEHQDTIVAFAKQEGESIRKI